MARNATPVAGSVMWARQLMRRIEGPIAVFKTNASLMSTKEAKKVVKVLHALGYSQQYVVSGRCQVGTPNKRHITTYHRK